MLQSANGVKKSWELTIDLGKDAAGKRRRKFVNMKGTKAEADRLLAEAGLGNKYRNITTGDIIRCKKVLREYPDIDNPLFIDKTKVRK